MYIDWISKIRESGLPGLNICLNQAGPLLKNPCRVRVGSPGCARLVPAGRVHPQEPSSAIYSLNLCLTNSPQFML